MEETETEHEKHMRKESLASVKDIETEGESQDNSESTESVTSS